MQLWVIQQARIILTQENLQITATNCRRQSSLKFSTQCININGKHAHEFQPHAFPLS